MERYRRGKAYRARSGSVNVLGGAPFGYRYIRKTPEAGARYEILEHEAVAGRGDVPPLRRRRRHHRGPGPLAERPGRAHPDRQAPLGPVSVIWGMLRNPAYAGRAVFGKTQIVHEQPGLNRVARLQGRTMPRPVKAVDRPREEWTEIAVPAIVDEDTFARVRPAAGRQQAVRVPQQHDPPVPAAGPGRLRGLRLRLLPQPPPPRPAARSTTTGAWAPTTTATKAAGYAQNKPVRADYLDHVVWDHITGLLADPALIHAEIAKPPGAGPHLRPRHQAAHADRTRAGQSGRLGHRDDRGVLRAADHHRRAARPDAAPARPRSHPARPARRARRPGRRPRRLHQTRRRPR